MDHKKLVLEVRNEIAKPFEERLARTKQIIKLLAKDSKSSVSCSFGKDSMVVLKLVLEENPKIPVIFGNTLIEFPETLKLRDKIIDEWDLNFVELRPEKGVNFWKLNDRILKENLQMDDGRKKSNICCYHLKDRPFRIWRKQNGTKISFTGITAIESRNRMFVACKKGMEYYSFKDNVHKVHPIMFWTDEEVWNFTRENAIPINEAYSKYGIDRIGCMWCMSHKNWRQQIAKINPKVYCYIMRRYRKTPSLLENM